MLFVGGNWTESAKGYHTKDNTGKRISAMLHKGNIGYLKYTKLLLIFFTLCSLGACHPPPKLTHTEVYLLLINAWP